MANDTDKNLARRIEDQRPAAAIDWSKPGAPAVAKSSAGGATKGGNTSLEGLMRREQSEDVHRVVLRMIGTLALHDDAAARKLAIEYRAADEAMRSTASIESLKSYSSIAGEKCYRAEDVERLLATVPPLTAPAVLTDEPHKQFVDAAMAFARTHIECDERESTWGTAHEDKSTEADSAYEKATARYNATKAEMVRAYKLIASDTKAAPAPQPFSEQDIPADAPRSFAKRYSALLDKNRALEARVAELEAAPAPQQSEVPLWDDNGEPWNEAAEEVERNRTKAAPAAPVQTPMLVPKWAGEFSTFNDWVNRAQRVLSVPSHKPNAICVDAKGRRCFIGADMARARDEGAFPVRYFWECEPVAPVQAEQAQAEPIGEVVGINDEDGQVSVGLYGAAPDKGTLVYLAAPAVPAQAEQVAAVRAAYEQSAQVIDKLAEQTDLTYKAGILKAAARDIRALATKEAAAPVPSQATLDVLAERRRQVEAEGWTPEHDDKYREGELRDAALCYLRWNVITKAGIAPGAWPWDEKWWKPADDRRNLVKAAALIIADIERLDRTPSTSEASKGADRE
jgi:hypothetical protein